MENKPRLSTPPDGARARRASRENGVTVKPLTMDLD
jgi:hypothetical protein